MSKSFQQLLFFFIISIPLAVQGKNGFPGFFGKNLLTGFSEHKQTVMKTAHFSELSHTLSAEPGTGLSGGSAITSKLVMKKRSDRFGLIKDITIVILGSVMIASFFRFRKIRKKQRSKLRQILRSRYRLGEETIVAAGKDGYGFPNISIEENCGDNRELNRPKTESLMTSETENKLLELLDDFESGTLYNNKNMSLPFLAVELNTNTKYLSFLINRHKCTDFKTYINRLRIGYIVEKLSEDEKYRQYKISILADECGFSSHSKFAAVFKAMTDYSPSAYIKLLDSGDHPDVKGFFAEEMSV